MESLLPYAASNLASLIVVLAIVWWRQNGTDRRIERMEESFSDWKATHQKSHDRLEGRANWLRATISNLLGRHRLLHPQDREPAAPGEDWMD